MKQLIIKTEQLQAWLDKIIESVPRVVAPASNSKGKTEFKVIEKSQEVDSDSLTTVSSVKAAAFPQTETLFVYQKQGVDTQLTNVSENNYVETVLWRVRPCDAVGFGPLSAIFNWDYKDSQYNSRRDKTTVVSFACNEADKCCFCTSVGGGPGNLDGSDIQITHLKNGNSLVEVVTDKGQKIIDLASSLFSTPANVVDKEAVLAQIPVKFTREQIHDKLAKAFDSPMWKAQSERCLGCGSCAFVCPTCACFDIQEDAHGSHGRRVRCWDSCGFSLFTLQTSGNNPRPTQSTRWRQRIMHKFSYMPDRLDVYGCTGCGRCSRACPVDMNLSEHLTSIANSDYE